MSGFENLKNDIKRCVIFHSHLIFLCTLNRPFQDKFLLLSWPQKNNDILGTLNSNFPDSVKLIVSITSFKSEPLCGSPTANHDNNSNTSSFQASCVPSLIAANTFLELTWRQSLPAYEKTSHFLSPRRTTGSCVSAIYGFQYQLRRVGFTAATGFPVESFVLLPQGLL